jgi:general secretion pathway protein A
MYLEHFGLTEYPFSLTPDPRFAVVTPAYTEILAGLYYGIEMAKGLTVVTGEVGTGKTMALRWIIRRLQSGVLASYIVNPHLTVDDFYHHLTSMLGIKQWSNKSELLTQLATLLEQRHQRGLRTILIVDEAHELSDQVLEEIRLLLNFENDTAKFLQVILTGQPELTERLRQPNLRQLKQRVALRCKVNVIPGVEEVAKYIAERLKIAGNSKANLFDQDSIELIYQYSEGIPRQVNNLCDNALLTAYSLGKKRISRAIIEEVAANLDMVPDRSALNSSLEVADLAPAPNVLTPEGKEELLGESKNNVEEFDAREFRGLREA